MCVCVRHTPTLWHAGYRHNLDSILRNGLLAGGPELRKDRRYHCYFRIADPRLAQGLPELRPDNFTGVTSIPYKVSDKLDAFYQVDVQRAGELGLRFYQNQSLAVLCDENIPPECIMGGDHHKR